MVSEGGNVREEGREGKRSRREVIEFGYTHTHIHIYTHTHIHTHTHTYTHTHTQSVSHAKRIHHAR